jgi:hypothetical protein
MEAVRRNDRRPGGFLSFVLVMLIGLWFCVAGLAFWHLFQTLRV